MREGRGVEWNLDHSVGKPNRSINVEWENGGHRPDPTRNRHQHWCADPGPDWENATDDDAVMALAHPWDASATPRDGP